LVKYPEINLMHKKMLYVSDQLALMAPKGRYKPKRFTEAQRELYQAQGNDAYWHGLFGGYYLNYLRHAVYEHLLKAEKLVDSRSSESPLRLTEVDLDRDGYKELLAKTPWMNLYLKPNEGATAFQIDYRPKALCLTHVPMRRQEAYHKRLQEKQSTSSSKGEKPDSIPSIHELVSVKETGLDRKLVYDRHPRWSFRDHLLESHTTLAKYESSQHEDLGGFSNQPYEKEFVRSGHHEMIVSFHRIGIMKDISLSVKKNYTLRASQAHLSVKYAFHHPKPSTYHFQPATYQWAVELNLTLLAGSDPKRYYRFPGKSVQDIRLCSLGIVEQVEEVYLVDEWQGIEIRLHYDPPARLWRFPVETVSQSEEGMESTYQGSCLVALWPLTLPLLNVREGLMTLSIAER
ncbi:MAG: DUF1926 domain-containing protein, partial [Nitrospira sp.]|nr:DUF1926 domain-containing protein [Nitrospira sp.]